jgi:hypothetical protein
MEIFNRQGEINMEKEWVESIVKRMTACGREYDHKIELVSIEGESFTVSMIDEDLDDDTNQYTFTRLTAMVDDTPREMVRLDSEGGCVMDAHPALMFAAIYCGVN